MFFLRMFFFLGGNAVGVSSGIEAQILRSQQCSKVRQCSKVSALVPFHTTVTPHLTGIFDF
jgi:hypothetical protein